MLSVNQVPLAESRQVLKAEVIEILIKVADVIRVGQSSETILIPSAAGEPSEKAGGVAGISEEARSPRRGERRRGGGN